MHLVKFHFDDILDDVSITSSFACYQILHVDMNSQSNSLVERKLEVLFCFVQVCDLAFQLSCSALQKVLQHADVVHAVIQSTVRVQL